MMKHFASRSALLLIFLTLSIRSYGSVCEDEMGELAHSHLPLVSLTQAVALLKVKVRTGWSNRGIPNGETVWQHSIKVAKAAGILFNRRYPELKIHAVRMGLFHDVAEYRVPDYTPSDQVDPAQKYAEERAAINGIRAIEGTDFGSLWEEYAAASSTTASLVKDLDKIDAALQAMIYSQQGYDVEEFFPAVEKKIRDKELLGLYRFLLFKFRLGFLEDPYCEYFKYLRMGFTRR